MNGPAALARRLLEDRGTLAASVIQRLEPRITAQGSSAMVRALISSLRHAIEAASADPVVAWCRSAADTTSPQIVNDLLGAACDVVAETAEPLPLDFGSLLAFLEVVRAHVREALPAPRVAQLDETERAAKATIDGILAMLDARDEATHAHAHATAAWCRRLAESMGLSAATTDLAVTACVLHDIGAIALPDAVLGKAGPLDATEWAIVQQHPRAGARILASLPALARCAPIVEAHHERWDGTGYPAGLRGEQIPFESRLVAVADAFHAMISPRPYRPPIPAREAMEILRTGAGTQWDPEIVAAMLALLQAPRTAARREAVRG